MIYVLFLSRARLDRRTQWMTKNLGALLPRRLSESPFAIFSVYLLGAFVVQIVVFGAALFGLLRVTDALTTLGAAFAFLLAAAVGVGVTTVSRTVVPQGEQRLLMAPIADRRAHLLAFAGAELLSFLESVLVMPVVVGVAASAVLRDEVSLPELWSAILLVVLAGPPLAYVINRSLGVLRVRRVSKGLGATSVVWYAVVSATTFVAGWLAARIFVPWLDAFPRQLEQSNRWVLSLSDYASEGLRFLLPLLTHTASPSGALARAALGEAGGLLTGALWLSATATAAVLLWPGSGGWYRSDWRSGWQSWERKDLLDLAEIFYLKLAGLFYRGNVLLEVQVHNLCRRREWAAANVFDLAGGAFNWFPVGLALGAAHIVSEPSAAAGVFAILIGAFQGAENARGPFVFFRGALALDAEGRQAGLYRAAGVSILELYRAKLGLGRLISIPPLLLSLIFIAVLGGLPLGAWLILFATAASAWVVALHGELLPSLVSPHFDWDHPDEIEDYYERDRLADWSSKLSGALFVVELALMGLLLSGRFPYGSFVFVASGLMSAIAVSVTVVATSLSRRVAQFNDRADFVA